MQPFSGEKCRKSRPVSQFRHILTVQQWCRRVIRAKGPIILITADRAAYIGPESAEKEIKMFFSPEEILDYELSHADRSGVKGGGPKKQASLPATDAVGSAEFPQSRIRFGSPLFA